MLCASAPSRPCVSAHPGTLPSLFRRSRSSPPCFRVGTDTALARLSSSQAVNHRSPHQMRFSTLRRTGSTASLRSPNERIRSHRNSTGSGSRVHRAPRRQILRDVPPLATGAQHIHGAAHHFPHHHLAFATAALGWRDQRLDLANDAADRITHDSSRSSPLRWKYEFHNGIILPGERKLYLMGRSASSMIGRLPHNNAFRQGMPEAC
jgi:hypothetical protein